MIDFVCNVWILLEVFYAVVATYLSVYFFQGKLFKELPEVVGVRWTAFCDP
jgi:hypothetical protein